MTQNTTIVKNITAKIITTKTKASSSFPLWYLHGITYQQSQLVKQELESKNKDSCFSSSSVSNPSPSHSSLLLISNHEIVFQSHNLLIAEFITKHVIESKRLLPPKLKRLRHLLVVGETLARQHLLSYYLKINVKQQQHEIYTMEDGGVVCTQTYWPLTYLDSTPVLFLIPSLTANQQEFIVLIDYVVNKLKWIVVVFNRRGNHASKYCSLRTPVFHICGHDSDIDYVVTKVKTLFPVAPMFGLGVSMGGNVLKRLLGRYHIDKSVFVAVGSICSPWNIQDLHFTSPRYEDWLIKSIHSSLTEQCKPLLFAQPDRAGVKHYLALTEAKTAVELFHANAAMFSSKTKQELEREYDAAEFVHNIQIPCLIITSDDDEIIHLSSATQQRILQSPMIGWFHAERGNHCLFRSKIGESFTSLNYAELLQLDFFQFMLEKWKQKKAE